MRLPPVLDILWARRLVVLTMVLSSLVGGFVVLSASTPRYRASARVVLDYIKPDPLTGAKMPHKMVTAYVSSQMQFIGDYQVLIPAAEALGLMDNSDLADGYALLTGRKPDYPSWIAQHLMGGLSVVPVEDSNILEIRFAAPDPNNALEVVDAIRTAYIDASLATRRQASEGSAQALAAQAEHVKAKLVKAQSDQAELARASGVTFQEGRRDFDSQLLQSLVTDVPRATLLIPEAQPTAARLAAVEAELAQAAKTLGPNHPRLRALQEQQKVFRAVVAGEAAAAGSAGAIAANRQRATAALIDQQKAKVLDQRQTVAQLRLYQDQIDGYREQMNSLTQRVAELRQLAAAKDTSITTLGEPMAKPKPVFPRPSLILGGSGALGLALGSLIALLCELYARRVRSVRGLAAAAGAPVLGAIPQVRQRRAEKTVRARPEKVRPRGKMAA